MRDEVDLDQTAIELAREQHVTTIECEICVVDATALRRVDRELGRHGVRITEIEPPTRFGHDNRRLAVGGEVHIVWIVDRDRQTRSAGPGINRRQAPCMGALGVVRDPQRFQIIGRYDMLRTAADLEMVQYLQRRRVDDVHIIRPQVRHVHTLQVPLHLRTQMVGRGFAVEIVRVRNGGHAWQQAQLGADRAVGGHCACRQLHDQSGERQPGRTAACEGAREEAGHGVRSPKQEKRQKCFTVRCASVRESH